MRRRRAVVKHVSQVSVAPAAKHFISNHPKRVVLGDHDIILRNRRPEAGPTRAGLELGFGIEENRIAANAFIQAVRMVESVFARSRPLGTGLARNQRIARGLIASSTRPEAFQSFLRR